MNNDYNKIEILKKKYSIWSKDWNKFASDVGNVKLDIQQQEILHTIQTQRRVSVRSGTSRGKDYVAAVGSICFLYLTIFDENWGYSPTKVINTAPTGRQIRNIMIPEISKFYSKAKRYLPGKLMADGIRFESDFLKDWYLHGFKADDSAVEAWSGIHAPNVMVVVTEASGISQIMYDSIEGILQGNSRLVLMFNPNNTNGEAYRSQFSPQYSKFRLNDLDAPNVLNYRKYLNNGITLTELKKINIPGQVDYGWVKEKIEKPGWVVRINKNEFNKELNDFEFEGKYYRPSDLFRIKVLGEFPLEAENALFPLSWIEAANMRWDKLMEEGFKPKDPLRLGVDVAGMGRDNTVFCKRYGNFVHKFDYMAMKDKRATVHMKTAGTIVPFLKNKTTFSFIDTIGEGAGVYSRLKEQNFSNAISAKSSFGAKGLTDLTGVRKFSNMRAYMFWGVRDALNPAFDINLALPRNDMLTEEMVETTYTVDSSGKIVIEKKEDIKKRIGRSIDTLDALTLTYFPEQWEYHNKNQEDMSKETLGLF